jgi:protoporphyrinogen oxidase/putative flippase GtrA
MTGYFIAVADLLCLVKRIMESLFKIYYQYRHMLLYGVIGVSAIVVDVLVFMVMFNLVGVHPVIATIISVTTAMVYAFLLNAFYNFGTKDYVKKRLISYATVSMLGLLLSAVIIEGLSRISIDPNIAKLISLPPIVIGQYLVNRRFAFKKTESVEVVNATNAVESTDFRAVEKKNIAIIGAGFTGLTAAYELSKLGHAVTVYEASDYLGGLVSGFELEGVPLEKAYHFLYKTDSEIINLAHEIGVGNRLHFYPSSISLFYDGKLYPFMTPLDLLRFTPLSLIDRVRAGLVAVYLAKQKKWSGFAQISGMDWMTKWGGAQVTKVIWEPILRGKFFNYYDKIAMSYVWSRIFVRANSKDKGDVTEKLGYFEGGFKTFTDALVEQSKKQGVKFITGTKLDSIASAGGLVTLKDDRSIYVHDACLATTPSHVFSKLIAKSSHVTEAYQTKLNSVDYIGAVLMVFTSKTKLTDYYWHNINDVQHPFLVLLSLSALVGTKQLDGKHIYYVGAYVPHDHEYFSMSNEAIQALWIEGIQKIFPDFTSETINASEIFKFKNAQHIVDVNYQRKILPYSSEIPGVYLANFTQIFPDDRGTNYAVAEGKKVAKLIAEELQSK